MNSKSLSLLVLSTAMVALSACGAHTETPLTQVDIAIERAEKHAAAIQDPDKKLAVYERIYKQNPKSAKAATEYARHLRKQGRVAQAESIMTLFAEMPENPSFVYAEFAAIKLANGEHASAEIYAKEALAQKEDDSFAYHTLGIALDGLGRYKEAEEAFRSALEIWDGNPVPVMNNLALNLATQGYIDEAISTLERAKTLEPSRTELERNLRIIRALNENSAAYFPDQRVPHPTKKPSN
jgi:Flp pilus assembly protein TadD|tara:strand:- start:371206 stop:371922 length:717 start_codon:yes stop_codon:yes gene_type:complete